MSENIIDLELNSSEEFIDVDKIYKYQNNQEEIKNIYQFQICNEKLIIKHISQNYILPDIIIKENFGPNSEYSLYSCVYSEDELNTSFLNTDIFFPLVKMIKKDLNLNTITTWSIAIKFTILINLDEILNKDLNCFELYLVSNTKDNPKINYQQIIKDINQDNIIEKLITYLII